MEIKLIGISISESQDMRELGMGVMHLQDALVESARHMLRKGYSLAYGGNLRYDVEFNFTNLLFQLAMTYGGSREDKVFNYSPFPLNTMITEEMISSLRDVGNVIPVIPPRLENAWNNVRLENASAKQKKELNKIIDENSAESNAIWAESLTFMRTKMAKEIDARLVMGGKVIGFKGNYPGIIEETVLAVQYKKSAVVDGRFGGAARTLLNILEGKPDPVAEKYSQFVQPLRSARFEFLNKDVAVIYGEAGAEHLKAITSAL